MHGALANVRILQFSLLFLALFRLEMPRDLGRIFTNLYCLKKYSKNHLSSFFISSMLHAISCFADLHDFLLKRFKTHLCAVIFYEVFPLTRYIFFPSYLVILNPNNIIHYIHLLFWSVFICSQKLISTIFNYFKKQMNGLTLQ